VPIEQRGLKSSARQMLMGEQYVLKPAPQMLVGRMARAEVGATDAGGRAARAEAAPQMPLAGSAG
jgi:hypothetical protein